VGVIPLGRLERELFGTRDPARVAEAVDGFCEARLGAGVGEYEFFATSVRSVHGVRLDDGRRVVVKVHRADAELGHLRAVARVQEHLADAGFPSPRPLLGPTPLAQGLAVVETLLDAGCWADPHRPAVRREMAASLARLVELCRPLAGLPGLCRSRERARRLWLRPHDRRFDFPGTSQGAAWIDRLGRAADEQLDALAEGADVIGHNDYRAEHLRFAGGTVSAVYDWDSLGVGPEPLVVASAAHAFTADWSRDAHRCVPTLDESRGFIADYESARGAPFTAEQRRTTSAGLVAALAYGARCEHSDRLTGFGAHPPRPACAAVPPDGYLAALATHGAALLRAQGLRPSPGRAE
jgi:aminoglycoside phosphotransferase (APT) family kinase protein